MSERPVEDEVFRRIEFEERKNNLYKLLSPAQKLTFALYLGGLNTEKQAQMIGVSRALIARDLKNIKLKAIRIK